MIGQCSRAPLHLSDAGGGEAEKQNSLFVLEKNGNCVWRALCPAERGNRDAALAPLARPELSLCRLFVCDKHSTNFFSIARASRSS